MQVINHIFNGKTVVQEQRIFNTMIQSNYEKRPNPSNPKPKQGIVLQQRLNLINQNQVTILKKNILKC